MRFKDRQKLQAQVAIAGMPRGGAEASDAIYSRARAALDANVRELAQRIDADPVAKAAMLRAHAKRMRKGQRFAEQLASRDPEPQD